MTPAEFPPTPDAFAVPVRINHADLSSGVRMRYYSAGNQNAPPVLLIHGFPELAVSWRYQVEALSQDYHVIAPDMRGYGGTSAPTGVSAYVIEKLAGDVEALIAHLDCGPVHLVGHDWGGGIVWEVAMRSPSSIRTLSALNCPPVKVLLRTVFTNIRQALKSWYMFYFQIPWLPEKLFCLDAKASAVGIFRDTAANKHPFTDAALAPFVAQYNDLGIVAMNYYRAAFRTQAPSLRAVDVPSQLIWGMRDEALGPWFAHDPVYETFASDFRRVLIDDAAHWVQEEAPDAVNTALRELFVRADGA